LDGNGPEGVGLLFRGHAEGENVTSGEPTEIGHTYFTDATGQLEAGVWECTAYTAEIDSYPVDEFAVILSGSVVITDETGHSETFNAGDSYVIPKGLKFTWHMPETMRKYFVILDSKAPGS
jgi:uncharacterized cupin superfamily protein